MKLWPFSNKKNENHAAQAPAALPPGVMLEPATPKALPRTELPSGVKLADPEPSYAQIVEQHEAVKPASAEEAAEEAALAKRLGEVQPFAPSEAEPPSQAGYVILKDEDLQSDEIPDWLQGMVPSVGNCLPAADNSAQAAAQAIEQAMNQFQPPSVPASETTFAFAPEPEQAKPGDTLESAWLDGLDTASADFALPEAALPEFSLNADEDPLAPPPLGPMMSPPAAAWAEKETAFYLDAADSLDPEPSDAPVFDLSADLSDGLPDKLDAPLAESDFFATGFADALEDDAPAFALGETTTPDNGRLSDLVQQAQAQSAPVAEPPDDLETPEQLAHLLAQAQAEQTLSAAREATDYSRDIDQFFTPSHTEAIGFAGFAQELPPQSVGSLGDFMNQSAYFEPAAEVTPVSHASHLPLEDVETLASEIPPLSEEPVPEQPLPAHQASWSGPDQSVVSAEQDALSLDASPDDLTAFDELSAASDALFHLPDEATFVLPESEQALPEAMPPVPDSFVPPERGKQPMKAAAPPLAPSAMTPVEPVALPPVQAEPVRAEGETAPPMRVESPEKLKQPHKSQFVFKKEAPRQPFNHQANAHLRSPHYDESLADALEHFEKDVIRQDSQFLNRSINNLVDRYFSEKGTDLESHW